MEQEHTTLIESVDWLIIRQPPSVTTTIYKTIVLYDTLPLSLSTVTTPERAGIFLSSTGRYIVMTLGFKPKPAVKYESQYLPARQQARLSQERPRRGAGGLPI